MKQSHSGHKSQVSVTDHHGATVANDALTTSIGALWGRCRLRIGVAECRRPVEYREVGIEGSRYLTQLNRPTSRQRNGRSAVSAGVAASTTE